MTSSLSLPCLCCISTGGPRYGTTWLVEADHVVCSTMAAMRAESSLDACSEQSDEHQDRHKDPLHVDDETRGRLEAEPPLREYLANKYKKDMRRHWDLFYKV